MTIRKDRLRLAAQTALLGCVTPAMLAVWVDARADEIKLRAYVDRELSDEQRDDIDAISTEIISAFAKATSLDVQILENVKPPLDQPDSGSWVFVRSGCSILLTKEQQEKLRQKGVL